jgi:Protein of unknown function (DUF3060)
MRPRSGAGEQPCRGTAGALVLIVDVAERMPVCVPHDKTRAVVFDIPWWSFIGSGQTTTLNCAGGGAHILGSNNTLTLTGACKRLDMVGSNNTVTVTFGNGAKIEFAGSNNAITWTSPDGKEPVVRHVVSGNTLTAGR